MERDYNLEKRKYVIGASVIVIVLIYLIRLFTLQIMSEDYKKNADSNAFLNKTQYPSRGVMYDRNGNLLVYNQPAYDVTMVMKEVHNLDTLDLCKTLNITPDYFKKRIREIKDRRSNPGYSPYTHQVFMTQLSAEECGVFQEKLFKFPGFIFSGVLSASIITMRLLMFWEILQKCPRGILKPMITMYAVTS